MQFKFHFIAVFTCLIFANEIQASGLYEKSHDVIVETIRTGHASGVMGGDMAKKFELQFKSKGVLQFEAKRLFSYKQSGCARVAIDYTKKDVTTPKGLTAVKLNTQINYCLDGRAPTSLEQASSEPAQ